MKLVVDIGELEMHCFEMHATKKLASGFVIPDSLCHFWPNYGEFEYNKLEKECFSIRNS